MVFVSTVSHRVVAIWTDGVIDVFKERILDAECLQYGERLEEAERGEEGGVGDGHQEVLGAVGARF